MYGSINMTALWPHLTLSPPLLRNTITFALYLIFPPPMFVVYQFDAQKGYEISRRYGVRRHPELVVRFTRPYSEVSTKVFCCF